MTGRNAAYTVFHADGRTPRRNRLGLVVFTRTLAAARAAAQPGDIVQGWGNSGSPRTRWTVGTRGRLHRQVDR